ncbi:MAG TPA: hypothetical protein ENO21_00590 [Firmicutes bacterium]|nr:hypothetical protein [Bacillota bacterium]
MTGRFVHSGWVALALVALVVALGAPQPAQAGKIDSLLLPEGIEDTPPGKRDVNLLDPEPWNGSWARPGHRPLGVNFTSYDLTQEQIDAAKATGCRMVRIELPMERFISQAEPDWAVLDVVVSRLGRAGLEVVPVLTAKSVVPQFYREFCESVAARYARSFRYYQILDNVNVQPGLYTRDYVELLIKVKLAITLADPDARIVTGGIRGADMIYLDLLEAQGAKDCFDVIAFNVYPPMAGIEGEVPGLRRDHCIPRFDEVCQWAAERGKAVWVTSLGVSTAYGGFGVDQLDQASAYARSALWLGWHGVERIFFAAIQDNDPSYSRPALSCGLLDVSGRPKASYHALKKLNRMISNAYHVDPVFSDRGAIYQVPDAATLMSIPPGELPEFDPYADYMLHGVKVFGFWFYEPDLQEYRLVYWLERYLVYDVIVSVGIRQDGLTPLEASLLLDDQPQELDGDELWDFTLVSYVPISTLPGIIRYRVDPDE